MREQSQSLLTAMGAVLLLLAGCDQALVEAKASSKPGMSDRYSTEPSPPVDLLQGTPPSAPEALPSAGFDGLRARVQQASDQAAASGATISVAILDRGTRQMVTNGNSQI